MTITTLDAIAALPVPQRKRDMARRLWAYIHANEPRMPEPTALRLGNGMMTVEWHLGTWEIEADVPGDNGGYDLWWHDGNKQSSDYGTPTFAIVDLLRVCQRFVAATAREVR